MSLGFDGSREILGRAKCTEVTNQRRYNGFKDGTLPILSTSLRDIADGLIRPSGRQSDEVFSDELALEGMAFLVKSRAWRVIKIKTKAVSELRRPSTNSDYIKQL